MFHPDSFLKCIQKWNKLELVISKIKVTISILIGNLSLRRSVINGIIYAFP